MGRMAAGWIIPCIWLFTAAFARLLQQFVSDELLRAPLLFDQLLDGTAGLRSRQERCPQWRTHVQRSASSADLMQALLSQRSAPG